MARTNTSYYVEATGSRASCPMCNAELDSRVDPPYCEQCGWRATDDEDAGAGGGTIV